jgi:SGT1 protein
MEGGSLVQEALQYMQRLREGGADDSLQSALWIDAFYLDNTTNPSAQRSLQKLATICQELNAALKTTLNAYPWHTGGDGPVFGVHVSSGYPHLRAICYYGANVNDEWVAIAGIFHLSKRFLQLAFQCWDVDDGHVLLIESAPQLPPWVDAISPDACRYRCWIVKGCITLIRPEDDTNKNLSLKCGINRLKTETDLEHPMLVQEAIDMRIKAFQDSCTLNPPNWSTQLHRSALILPRTIANLIRCHPNMVNCAVTAFSQHCHSQQPPRKMEFNDLVWTEHPFARTSYAMLRTLITSVWDTEDHIPTVYNGIETRRMRRLCQVESTPHLAHALDVGVRLMAGFDYILGQTSSVAEEVTVQDRIMKQWTMMDIACGGDGKWLEQAFVAGPNHATLDLQPLVKCPVYNVDLKRNIPCPLSSPGIQLQGLTKQLLKQSDDDGAIDFVMPGPNDVDSDTWMNFSDEDLERTHKAREQDNAFNNSVNGQTAIDVENKVQQQVLSNMLGSFHNFVDTTSNVEGISHDDEMEDKTQAVEINPRIFMNLLHKVLMSSPEELTECMHIESSDTFFGDDDEDAEADEEVVELMSAMDNELQQLGHIHKDVSPVNLDASVLSNLLASLDISGSGPGPVQNILREMGIDPPDLPSETGDHLYTLD